MRLSLLNISFALATAALAGVAAVGHATALSWRLQLLIFTAIVGVHTLGCAPWLLESPRFLLDSRRCAKEAEAMLRKGLGRCGISVGEEHSLDTPTAPPTDGGAGSVGERGEGGEGRDREARSDDHGSGHSDGI